MIIYQYPQAEKLNIRDCVLALGFFDGVHIAHRDLMLAAKRIAEERGLAFGIFTFGSDGGIKKNVRRLYDDGEKAELFCAVGADFTVYADFGKIASLSPEEFVENTLCADLNCRVCVAGFNFRFGKGAAADSGDLIRLMAEAGAEAVICEEITDNGKTLSATLIRGLIEDGRTEEANRLLGSPYYIKGRVSHGRCDGRKMGFPTVNIAIGEGKILPKRGVYRSAAVIEGKIYGGVSNIGICPTFDGEEIRLETHLIGYDGDLYDKEMRIYLLGYLREEKKFGSVDELKEQIQSDRNRAIKENGEITWQELGLK